VVVNEKFQINGRELALLIEDSYWSQALQSFCINCKILRHKDITVDPEPFKHPKAVGNVFLQNAAIHAFYMSKPKRLSSEQNPL
jgi:hypothetical protein